MELRAFALPRSFSDTPRYWINTVFLSSVFSSEQQEDCVPAHPTGKMP
jgi:hypothetical protein